MNEDMFAETPPGVLDGLGSKIVSMSVGYHHQCVILEGGVLKCWGDNNFGEVGKGSWGASVDLPVEVVGIGPGVKSVSAGGSHTCAASKEGKAFCWGRGKKGQIGDGSMTEASPAPVAVSGLSSGVALVAAGQYHSCAALDSGETWCWGSNTSGQLGDGTKKDSPVPVKVKGLAEPVFALRAGDSHTCAMTTSGALYCWGANGSGQVGDGSAWSSDPVPVAGIGPQASCPGGLCTCTAQCSGKKCGEDGCGGPCGACEAEKKCVAGVCVACLAEDCGGSCGDCEKGETCWKGLCTACNPVCSYENECGPDGCGGSCGECPKGQVCNGYWQCAIDPKACTHVSFYDESDLAGYDKSDNYFGYVAAAGDAYPTDLLFLDLWLGEGAPGAPGTYQIGLDDVPDASSMLIIGENCKSADWLSCGRLFVAVKAELVIELFDLTGETAGTPFFSASIGDAFLTEFTADPVTEEVKFVPGGETWCLKQHPTVAEIKVVE
jgi:hypothetical protein